ncbi:hypothetical protein H9P43_006975 [Blastocladiella emersonii ATCC 22665]|nr:hypothetical protein H9P43_006975 [Blastocladiella emersonii ATCC 22665]
MPSGLAQHWLKAAFYLLQIQHSFCVSQATLLVGSTHKHLRRLQSALSFNASRTDSAVELDIDDMTPEIELDFNRIRTMVLNWGTINIDGRKAEQRMFIWFPHWINVFYPELAGTMLNFKQLMFKSAPSPTASSPAENRLPFLVHLDTDHLWAAAFIFSYTNLGTFIQHQQLLERATTAYHLACANFRPDPEVVKGTTGLMNAHRASLLRAAREHNVALAAAGGAEPAEMIARGAARLIESDTDNELSLKHLQPGRRSAVWWRHAPKTVITNLRAILITKPQYGDDTLVKSLAVTANGRRVAFPIPAWTGTSSYMPHTQHVKFMEYIVRAQPPMFFVTINDNSKQLDTHFRDTRGLTDKDRKWTSDDRLQTVPVFSRFSAAVRNADGTRSTKTLAVSQSHFVRKYVRSETERFEIRHRVASDFAEMIARSKMHGVSIERWNAAAQTARDLGAHPTQQTMIQTSGTPVTLNEIDVAMAIATRTTLTNTAAVLARRRVVQQQQLNTPFQGSKLNPVYAAMYVGDDDADVGPLPAAGLDSHLVQDSYPPKHSTYMSYSARLVSMHSSIIHNDGRLVLLEADAKGEVYQFVRPDALINCEPSSLEHWKPLHPLRTVSTHSDGPYFGANKEILKLLPVYDNSD